MEFLQENWWYLLFVGAMMFMMFRRGGCCGGHSYGGYSHGGDHGSHYPPNTNQSNTQTMDMVKDPVCGMYINPNTAIHEVINGKTYYFCSEACRNEFRKRQ
ncbi:YHS domain-containing protein [Petroclostridium xylanilyticum]|uniref:YHS domain-containing protein n=1 Tax=Petroclostridium xylanilyticum TaxID=1792311 RepID=UPI0018E30B0E|nr:YHS domain-containing protein [Petroclostridium xylanilyticum]